MEDLLRERVCMWVVRDSNKLMLKLTVYPVVNLFSLCMFSGSQIFYFTACGELVCLFYMTCFRFAFNSVVRVSALFVSTQFTNGPLNYADDCRTLQL
jgi:hypothetical protein